MAKFKHGRKWGSNRKQRKSKRRWEVCMQMVGRKFTDRASSIKIKQTDEVTNMFKKELARNSEYEDKLDWAN